MSPSHFKDKIDEPEKEKRDWIWEVGCVAHYEDNYYKGFNKNDNVNHPKHYTEHPSGVECIEITEHMSFTLGNVIKYLWRADLKNGVEDLKKAQWYLQREIARREKE